MISLKQLRARLAAKVAQQVSPHVSGPAAHHDSEVAGTVGRVQVDRTQHVKACTSAWQLGGCMLVRPCSEGKSPA